MKICDTLMPNAMPCPHHAKKLIIINCKKHQYFNYLINEMNLSNQ